MLKIEKMVKKKNLKRNKKGTKNSRKVKKHKFYERILLVLFTIFIVVSVLAVSNIIPQNKINNAITGFLTKTVSLNKASYNGSEMLKGTVSLKMDQQDIIPGNATMTFSILTDASKCPTKYVCPGGLMVDWHIINATTGECEIKEPDPEGACCLKNVTKCGQIILNKDFSGGLDSWIGIPTSSGGIRTESFTDYDYEGNPISLDVAVEDSSSATRNTNYSLKQALGTRKISVGSLYRVGLQTKTVLSEWYCNNVTNKCQNYSTVCPSVCSNGACTSRVMAGYQPPAVISPQSSLITGGAIFIGGITVGSITGYAIDPPACSDSDGGNITTIKGTCSENGTQKGNDSCIQQSSLAARGYFKYKVAWQNIRDAPCSFEIVVKGESSGVPRSLHYFYQLDPICNHGPENNSEQYIEMSIGESSEGSPMNWDIQAIDIYSNWTSSNQFGSGSVNDNITDIYLISSAKVSGDYSYGQKVWLDYIKIEKPDYAEPSNNCTVLNKTCCLEGTGLDSYLGRQLNCSTGYECWGKCTDSVSMKLSSFISKSGSSSKYNRTSGDECQAIVDGQIIGLKDPCYTPDGVGRGYTACLVTNSGTCLNWDNTYRVNFSTNGINLKAPNKNGSYVLKWRFDYKPVMGLDYCPDPEDPEKEIPCLIFEEITGFTVGSVSNCTENWVDVSNWSTCENGFQWMTRRDQSQCPQNGPSYLINVTQSCGTGTTCAPNSYQCSGSIYQQCSADGLTWNTLNDCSTQGQSCDAAQGGCYTPCTPNCFNAKCNDPDGCGGICSNNCGTGPKFPWIIIVIAAGIIIVIVVILLLVLKKKKPQVDYSQTSSMGQGFGGQPVQNANPQYPEVVSYIRDAVAAGAGKPDIKMKLQEAGWPDDAIEQSFRDCGM